MRSVAIRAGLAVATAAPVLAGGSHVAAAAPGCPVAPSPAGEAVMVAMTKATRASHGAATLRRDDAIADAARRWSMRMARTGDFAHSTLSWTQGRSGGQNIAVAPTVQAAYRLMLGSRPHRRNLLTRAWRFIGVGVAVRCDGARFVTINLMAPPPIPPLTDGAVNRGASSWARPCCDDAPVPRTCTVCRHPERAKVDAAQARRAPFRVIAGQHGLAPSGVQRRWRSASGPSAS